MYKVQNLSLSKRRDRGKEKREGRKEKKGDTERPKLCGQRHTARVELVKLFSLRRTLQILLNIF